MKATRRSSSGATGDRLQNLTNTDVLKLEIGSQKKTQGISPEFFLNFVHSLAPNAFPAKARRTRK